MNPIPDGRSLELYFIDGRPDGMLTAEVFNWTGHVLMTPRTRIGAALARKEARYTGVYLLLGEQDGERRAYIGVGRGHQRPHPQPRHQEGLVDLCGSGHHLGQQS